VLIISLNDIFFSSVETIVPSTAMEYSYARRVKKFSTNQARDVVHTWEIAGGSSLLPMIEIALSPQCIHRAVVVITLDLSKVILSKRTK
jgi:dynein light intermediate chain 2